MFRPATYTNWSGRLPRTLRDVMSLRSAAPEHALVDRHFCRDLSPDLYRQLPLRSTGLLLRDRHTGDAVAGARLSVRFLSLPWCPYDVGSVWAALVSRHPRRTTRALPLWAEDCRFPALPGVWCIRRRPDRDAARGIWHRQYPRDDAAARAVAGGRAG